VKLDFFALRSDFESLFEFIWQETDCRVAEAYSPFDHELRWFDFFGDIADAYPIGTDHRASKVSCSFMLWSRSAAPTFRIQRIALDQRRVKGHTHRYSISGTGLIHLSLGGLDGNVITPSSMGHISQQRARVYGTGEHVDWPALLKLARKIDYHVRKRLASAKTLQRSIPILPEAHEKYNLGWELREGAGSTWKYDVAADAPAPD
jgi:hypothetical protein